MMRSTERTAGADCWGCSGRRGGPAIGSPGGRPPARPRALPTASGAIEPAAPVLPAEVVAAMQEARYDEARRALIALGEKAAERDDRAYSPISAPWPNGWRAIATRPGRSLQAALRAAPATRWAAKIRFELAGIELAAGNWAAAEELTRAEADPAAGRPTGRIELAEVYHAFAQKLLEPDDPVVRPDPNAAYELLDQARELAESPALRARFLVAMGRASLAANNPARADRELRAVSQGASRRRRSLRVRFQLGEAQLKSQPAPAGPPDLDRPGSRHRAAQAGRDDAGPRRHPRHGALSRSPRPTASPTRPTTPA